MSLSKEALEYQYLLGSLNSIHELDGYQFAPEKLGLKAVKYPEPEALEVSSLTGLIDYITVNRDELELSQVYMHVVSPSEVALRGVLMYATQQRPVYARAYADLPNIQFERFLSSADFILQLHYGFQPSEERTELLEFMGSIKEGVSKITEDDGISQNVSVSAGIRRSEEAKVPNPVTLKPFRTFQEIKDQPASLFTLRMQPGPMCGLWEADGGAWRNEAMQAIKAYLVEKLPEGLAVIA